VTKESQAPLAIFLCLTFGLSAVFWWFIARAGSIGANGSVYLLALMWSPGVSALVTRFVFRRDRTSDSPRSDVARWGWRSFLVPALARRMSFGWTAVVSGVIWAAWHVPLIVLADYNACPPARQPETLSPLCRQR
jgi:hypothetical protein